jgi:hypothetical protein
MGASDTILQIVPHLPGTFDGVGDYALNLARALTANHRITTTFLVADKTAASSVEGYAVLSGLSSDLITELAQKYDQVILHYVNYGYQARGVPFSLRKFVQQLRRHVRGRWVTTFHELYASGPPWKSEFWVRPFQVKIAHDVIDLSDACIVSNEAIAKEIRAYDAEKQLHLAPVISNFGEPPPADLTAASPKRWAICGGTPLVYRSLLLFERLHPLIPPVFFPDHLDVIGGGATNSTREIVERLTSTVPGLSCHYHPEVSVEEASLLLRQASFGWVDYFGKTEMTPGMILKSTAFAAFCAHAVVPICSHREEVLGVEGDPFPGPWYLTSGVARFPGLNELSEVREKIYAWYWAHAASPRLARCYADALGATP